MSVMTDPLGAVLSDLEARASFSPSGPRMVDPIGQHMDGLLAKYSLAHVGGQATIAGQTDPDIAEIDAAIGNGVRVSLQYVNADGVTSWVTANGTNWVTA
ncbi:hypothetical protein QMZ05_12550 [Bradyrhizobium sp. INPA03-11B]|uniref:hypothetical protein n=1 Tax=Bradyrhizobium sp. INPA03-11B TaxID=418598 RepID=UPI0033905EB7